MKLRVSVSLVLIAAVVTGLSGCKKKNTPTGPDNVQVTTSVPAVAPLPISVVAPYIGQTVNSVLENALRQGLTKSGAGRWTYNCPAGGTGRVDLSDRYQVGTGDVVMLDTDFILTDCTIETNGATFAERPSLLGRLMNFVIRPVAAQSRARIVAKGRLRTKGKWRPPRMSAQGPYYRDEPVRVTGTLDVDQANCGGAPCPSQIGAALLECAINGKVCEGNIGGIGVHQGPPDTPPSPNPTTTTSTTTTTTTTIPGPPPPGAVNVTGRWFETISGSAQSNGSRTVVLSQSGSTITGDASGLPSGFSGSFTGTISGTSVNLTETYIYRDSVQGFAVSCTITIRHALTASTNQMSGTWTSNGRCTFSGDVSIPPIDVSDRGNATFTRQ